MRNYGTTEREFDRFVGAAAPRLVRTAYLVIGDFAEAEDVAQDALAIVARKWGRVRAMESPYGYARRILFNLALREQTHRRRRGQSSAEVPDVGVGDDVDLFMDRDEILSAIGCLPPRQRAVLVLRYWEDLSESETAATLGCSVGTVKSQSWKAINHLRQIIHYPKSPETTRGVEKGTRR